jgi:parallel beta-helix repeat protein
MPVGATTTANGIKVHGDYSFTPPASFFTENAIPSGANVFIPQGLVADVNHDNRAVIQAAIDEAYAAGGGIVYIPPGVYGVGDNPDETGCVILKNNVFLKGAGMGETTLRVMDHIGDIITGIIRSPFGEETNNYGASDITLDGNRANNDAVLEHVDGLFTGGIPGDTVTDHDVTFLRVEIHHCSGYGFDPHERTERLLIDSSVAHHNGKDGFVADYIIDGEYRNNIAYENDRHGFNLTTTTNDFLIHNNIARDNGSTGITIQRGNFDIPVPYNIVVRDNLVTGNAREGILVQMGENILIMNNTVEDSGRTGIRVYGASYVTVRHNDVSGSSHSMHDEYADIQIREYDDLLGVSGKTYKAHFNLIEKNHLIGGGTPSSSYGIAEREGDVGDNVFQNNTITGQVRGVYKLYADSTIASFHGLDGDDQVEGNGAVNWFHGGGGADSLKGEGGNDYLNGGDGADTLSGGTGDDTYIVNSLDDKVSEKPGEGYDRVFSTISYELKKDVEFLRLKGEGAMNGKGNEGDNILVGNDAVNELSGKEGNDRIYGHGGEDVIKGGDGNDRIDGGAGADQMSGGLGNDSYYVDNADDDVSEDIAGGSDTVFSSVSYTLKGNVEKLVFIGDSALDGTGNALGNEMTGNDSNNVVSGGRGDDRLNGKGGEDTLKGGAGDDTLNGGDGADTMSGGAGDDTFFVNFVGDEVNEKAGEGTDTIYTSVSYTMKEGIENLYLTGLAYEGKGNVGDDSIFGNGLANVLRGAEGDDSLSGSGGDDILKGGQGSDTMSGGAGADVFSYDSDSEIVDEMILDFNSADGDKIDLASVDAGTAAGHQDFVFTGASPFLGIGRELRYETEANGISLMGDRDGDRLPDFVIHIIGATMLNLDDLII